MEATGTADVRRLIGLKRALQEAPTVHERLVGRMRRDLADAPLNYERKVAKLRAEILSIELGGPTAPAAADAWARVAELDHAHA